MDLRETIGINVKRLRLAAGLTQEELAVKAASDQRFISETELGKRNLTIDNLENIALTLGTSVVVLVSEPSDEARKG
jgi:transcriptional regulator with XRE-family HTH domain